MLLCVLDAHSAAKQECRERELKKLEQHRHLLHCVATFIEHGLVVSLNGLFNIGWWMAPENAKHIR